MDDSERTFIFLTGPATQVARAVFATVYCHEDMDSKNGTLSLRECYEARRKNTPGLIPKKMNSVEDYFDNQNPDKRIYDRKDIFKSELDISFYCSGIDNFCRFKGCEHLLEGDALTLVINLRKERNNFMHASIAVDVDDVQQLCLNLLDKVEEKLGGVHIAEARPEIKLLMKKVRNEKFDREQYLNDRENFRQKLKKEFVTGSLNELEIMNFDITTNPFTKLLQSSGASAGNDRLIEGIFTPPFILSNEEDVNFLDVILPPEEGKPVTLVLSGQSGSGKSTLCHVIFEQWRTQAFGEHKIKSLDSIDLIVYVKLKFTEKATLDDFLRTEYLVDQMRYISKEAVVPLLRSLEVLCIIDGFDEKNKNADDLICNIASCLPKSRIIITSRPEFEEDCKKLLLQKPCAVWNLEGFRETERREFSTKVIRMVKENDTDSINLADCFISYLESRTSTFQSHLKSPLTVGLMIFLWLEHSKSDAKKAITTATQLQRYIFEMLKNKLTKNCSDSEKAIKDLQERAFHQLNLNQHLLGKLSERALETSPRANDVNMKELSELFDAFLTCDTKHLKDSLPTSLYSFLHQPQMNFFSADYVSHDLKESLDQKRCLKIYFKNSKKGRYKKMFPYLAGCLAQNGQLSRHSKALLELCRKANISKDDYNFWFSLLHETVRGDVTSGEMLPDKTLQKEIISYLTDTWTLKSASAISGLKLLAFHPGIKSLELTLDLHVTSTKDLVETLENLREHQSKLQGSKTDLVLHVKNQGSDSSYVKYFGDWCTLVKFTGCVREDEVKYLMQSKTVNATFHEVKAFNAMARSVAKMKSLEQLTMSVDFPKNHLESEGACPEPIITERRNHTTDLNFLSLIDEDITKTIQFVRSVCPRHQVSRIRLRGENLSFQDGVAIVKNLQGCVTDKVLVHSNQFLTEDQEKEIMQTAIGEQGKSSFILVWKDEEICSDD